MEPDQNEICEECGGTGDVYRMIADDLSEIVSCPRHGCVNGIYRYSVRVWHRLCTHEEAMEKAVKALENYKKNRQDF